MTSYSIYLKRKIRLKHLLCAARIHVDKAIVCSNRLVSEICLYRGTVCTYNGEDHV